MSQTQPFRLLDLPLEVRAMIFSEMLVEEKWIYKSTVDVEGNTHNHRKENIGHLMVDVLQPDKYERWYPLFTKRTSFLLNEVVTQSKYVFTTYKLPRGMDHIRILQTNRQIYQEASAIFYSRNMFYANDCPAVVIPFMKDRGTRSLDSLRSLSIMYPSAMINPKAVREKKYHAGCTMSDESAWEDVCCYISLHLHRLAHLDLRVQRGLGIHFEDLNYKMDEWKSLQTDGDFPMKRRDELARLSPETKITVSRGALYGWARLDALGIPDSDGYEDVVLSPLRPWLADSICDIRTLMVPQGLPHSHSQLHNASFWTARRRARKIPVYTTESSDDDDDSDDTDDSTEQTDSSSEDSSHQSLLVLQSHATNYRDAESEHEEQEMWITKSDEVV